MGNSGLIIIRWVMMPKHGKEQEMRNQQKESGMVVNLHFTDFCNCRCRFCHSRFQRSRLGLADWERIIDNIAGDLNVQRFNLAGGEPLASPFIQGLIDAIHDRGYDASIITNGLLLNQEFIARNIGKLSVIGISVDGVCAEDHKAIGRVNTRGESMTGERFVATARMIREAGMRLKVNTVVNALNKDKDFGEVLRVAMPDRWKVFRMLLLNGMNDDAADLAVTDDEFRDFVSRHRAYNPVVEDAGDIRSSYIVVNPDGKLIDNSSGSSATTDSLVGSRFRDEFAKIGFNFDAYLKRYVQAA